MYLAIGISWYNFLIMHILLLWEVNMRFCGGVLFEKEAFILIVFLYYSNSYDYA